MSISPQSLQYLIFNKKLLGMQKSRKIFKKLKQNKSRIETNVRIDTDIKTIIITCPYVQKC